MKISKHFSVLHIDEVECELADAIFFNADRCTRSADLSGILVD